MLSDEAPDAKSQLEHVFVRACALRATMKAGGTTGGGTPGKTDDSRSEAGGIPIRIGCAQKQVPKCSDAGGGEDARLDCVSGMIGDSLHGTEQPAGPQNTA